MSVRKVKVKVKQVEEKPVERNVLAQSIVDISRAAVALSRGGLNRRAIVALIHDGTSPRVGKGTIRIVLESIRDLERDFCMK